MHCALAKPAGRALPSRRPAHPLEARGRPQQHAPALARQWSPTRAPCQGSTGLFRLRYPSASTARDRQQLSAVTRPLYRARAPMQRQLAALLQPAASASKRLRFAAPRATKPPHPQQQASLASRVHASSAASASAPLTQAPTQAAAPLRQPLACARRSSSGLGMPARTLLKSPCLCAKTLPAP